MHQHQKSQGALQRHTYKNAFAETRFVWRCHVVVTSRLFSRQVANGTCRNCLGTDAVRGKAGLSAKLVRALAAA